MSQPPENWQAQPRVRAGDPERQRSLEVLTRAWREGRITRDEFAERSSQAMNLTYIDEISALTSDLGPATLATTDTNLPAATAQQFPAVRDRFRSADDNLPVRMVEANTPATRLTVGVMSGQQRTGYWVVPPQHTVFGVWGGATIDLRDAVFTSAEVTITCIAVMGGIEVIVPPELDVRVTGMGFMGGFGWEHLDDARPYHKPSPENPTVTINGLGFWGGVGITRAELGEDID